MRLVAIVFGIFWLALASAPSRTIAQSLEWLAEHPSSTTLTLSSTTPTTSTTTEAAATSTPAIVNTNKGLEAKVHLQFADVPVMIEIARCESMFRQFDSQGRALDGGAGSMIGVFQINAPVHASFAKTLGMDIYTTDGNLAYARYLYNKSGTDPWVSSLGCWNATAYSVSESAGGALALVSNLSFGMVHPEVLHLQKLLNSTGNVIAPEGPGSPGQETTKFGSLTRAAVRNFQCKSSIACGGDEYSSGYGFVGPRTRKALLTANYGAVPVPTTIPPPATPQGDREAEVKRLETIIAELVAQIVALQKKAP